MDENCFRISKQEPTGDLNFYTLQKNRFPCNSALCLVQCERCPKGIACAHEYTCTCQQYAYRNSCKHSHILMLSERLTPNAVSDCDDRASSISADDRVKTVAGPVFVDGVETVGVRDVTDGVPTSNGTTIVVDGVETVEDEVNYFYSCR
ncbi:uncharacterized protein LOC131878823 [Tigriopus californicus]|uniref:uncharacterized protein LOC131878823 n=1 Tax=Tigriopus californicus TaxID=6832 RepID=UPI0027DA78E1|nr:uncharacterized protein LOC131878823 [Tigriopus californicus]